MAVNSSGKPPVNSLGDDDHFGLADLGRIRDQYHTEPAAIRASRLRGEQADRVISTINEIERDNPGATQLPMFQKELLRSTRVRSNVNSRLGIYQESKQDRLNEQAANMVGREFSTSAVNSYVARNANSLDAQVAGMALTGQGYASLGVQRAQIMNQMQGLRQDSMAAAGSYIDQGGINKNSASVLQGGSDQMKELAKQLIPITLAMQQLKQQGLDPKGRQEELTRIGNKASGVLHSNQLEDEMKSGTGLGKYSMGELKKKEAEAAEKLIKALSALNNAAGKTTDELTELNKGAEEAAKEFKEINEARGEKGRDGGNKFDSVKLIAGTIAEVLELGTGLYQNVAINQPMQMVANTAAAANLENEKYNSWHAALAGNMHERMNLNWDSARGFGNTMASNQNTVHNLREGNAAINVGLGTAQTGISIYNGVTSAGGAMSGINVIEQGAQGVKVLASGLASGVSELAAQQRQTEMAALRISGAHAYKNAEKALSKISGQQLQGYRDYAMGINETAGAMGGEVGEAFLNRTGSAAFLGTLSEAGIGTKEFNALSLRGQQQMGDQFNENQIFGATNLERKGFGTADINMQRIGMLSTAGQGDSAANLGKIIEDAMQHGLNSSKAIDMIVENTAKMGETAMLAGAAGDSTTGITNQILRAVDLSNPNKVQALKMAQQGFDRGEAAQTNTAASLTGFMNVDRNMKVLGVDRRSAQILTGLSTGEIEALKKLKDEKSTAEYLSRIGINSSGLNPSLRTGSALGGALDQTGASAILAGQEGRGLYMNASGAYETALEKSRGNPALTKALVFGKDHDLLAKFGMLDVYTNQMASWKVGGTNGVPLAARAAVKKGLLNETLTEKELDALDVQTRAQATSERRLSGSAESAQAGAGAGALGPDAKSAMAALAESGRLAFEKMSEKAWGTAAQETAKNLGDSATLTGNAATKLESAAKAMSDSTQLMAASGASFAAAVADAITKIKDKLGMLHNDMWDKKDHNPLDWNKVLIDTRPVNKNE